MENDNNKIEEMKVDTNSEEYKSFEKALDKINGQIVKVNDSLAKTTDINEMNALGTILKGLLEDRKKICDEDKETIKRIANSDI